jgi:hypothetical protein
MLADIQASTAAGSLQATSDPNFLQFTFTNTGNQIRRFPTLRLDFNITDKHHLEAIGNYQDFASTADFLNGADSAFPAPVPQIVGSQGSNRISGSFALRSQLTPRIVNEARFGKNGSTVLFFPEPNRGSFEPFGFVAPLLSSVTGLTDSFSANTRFPSRRNAPVTQFYDNLSWSTGRHNLNFGGSFNRTTFFSQSTGNGIIPSIVFGLPTTDPASNAFSSATLPGADATQIAAARTIYATLVGKITSVNFSAALDEIAKTYSVDNPFAIQRNSVNGFGFFFQDYFKVKPNLSINWGLRWEAGLAPRHDNEVYTRPTFEGLFGVSGPGNLFNPGTTGQGASVLLPVTKDTRPFADDLNNFGPSLGIAWSPNFDNSWLKRMFGEGDKTVIRAAYAISYVTGGFADFTGIWGNNPGLFSPVSQLAGREFAAGSLLLRNPQPAFILPTRSFPRATRVGESINDYDPNLRTPYVQSWSFGIQREITRDTAIEFRYLGNHGTKLGRNLNLNEVNIFENGFLDEFIAAQRNLQIFQAANPNCGTPGNPACSFRNAGLPGQVALPIFQASFGSATSANFQSATFIEQLRQGRAGASAVTLGNQTTSTTFQANRIAAGLAANFFIVNPNVMGANSTLQTNGGDSTYNSLQIEVRRRLSQGLLLNGSYVWSHAITNNLAFGTNQPFTLRNLNMNKGESPFDLRHAFKVSYVYDLPFGSGQRFDVSGAGGVISSIISGWQTDGIIRWQTGRMFLLTSGRQTVNASDGGVILVGMDAKELQREIKIRKLPGNSLLGNVFFLPDDIIENSLRAFGLRPGAPSGRYIAPPTTPGVFGSRIFLRGPNFFRADLSLLKKHRITERVNAEFRAEFLNAFNNPNFLIGGSPAVEGATVAVNALTFGQTGFGYFDQSTTDDPGGRLVQLVFRINF